ncbi:unnamed protein product [Trichobilharzia regenti]|nr:unnamed protein product [Trichobilharzia regenti]
MNKTSTDFSMIKLEISTLLKCINQDILCSEGNSGHSETFFYDLNASEAGSRTLEVTVWDFDHGPSNDFIGGLTLGAGAKAERRELWLAVFRPPYRRIEAWFQLSNRTENGNQFTTPGVCD